MSSARTASSSVFFGFGTLAIGLIVVRNSDHPLITAALFGLVSGGIRQLIWYVLGHELLRWRWQENALISAGGFLALTLFMFRGLAIPNKAFMMSIIIIACIAAANFIGDRARPRITLTAPNS